VIVGFEQEVFLLMHSQPGTSYIEGSSQTIGVKSIGKLFDLTPLDGFMGFTPLGFQLSHAKGVQSLNRMHL
jgi:hypothetical protein